MKVFAVNTKSGKASKSKSNALTSKSSISTSKSPSADLEMVHLSV